MVVVVVPLRRKRQASVMGNGLTGALPFVPGVRW